MNDNRIGEPSGYTIGLYHFLRAKKPKDEITYQELSEEIGDNIKRHRSCLRTARKWLEENDLKSFRTVKNVGIVCLPPEEIIDETRKGISRMGRLSKRINRKLECIKSEDFQNFTKDKQTEFILHKSLFKIGEFITEQKSISFLKNDVVPKLGINAKPQEIFKKYIELKENE